MVRLEDFNFSTEFIFEEKYKHCIMYGHLPYLPSDLSQTIQVYQCGNPNRIQLVTARNMNFIQ